jgi:glutathione S-transferase
LKEDAVKLYYHPVSTTSRPVVLFATESGIDLDYRIVDLFSGAQYQPEYGAINPSRQVPVLEDDEFRLTESSAILKYLADKIDSPAYPKDLRQRARVNERMDWLNTGFYRDFSYGFLYPQIFPFMRRPDEVVQAGTVAWGKDKALTWLKVLDESWLDDGARRRGDRLQVWLVSEHLPLARQHEKVEELAECQRSVLQVRSRAQHGQGVRPALTRRLGRGGSLLDQTEH